jgi:predicted RNase H-like nuclease
MSQAGVRRGPELPYKLIAGVVPCPGGWLVASARLQGITAFPQEAFVLPAFADVLDYKPTWHIVALGLPVGLNEKPTKGGRTCDRQARKLLGFPRSGAVVSPPIRPALQATTYAEAAEINGGMGAVTWQLFPKIREVDGEMQPYWQRTVFEVHPELSFYQLNDDQPMRFSKNSSLGQKERRTLLEHRIERVENILEADLPGTRMKHLIDAAACLWTSRRIASKAVSRVPEDPEWDEQGLRVEIMR